MPYHDRPPFIRGFDDDIVIVAQLCDAGALLSGKVALSASYRDVLYSLADLGTKSLTLRVGRARGTQNLASEIAETLESVSSLKLSWLNGETDTFLQGYPVGMRQVQGR
jgi:hypothetical protein